MNTERLEQAIASNCKMAHFYASRLPPDPRPEVIQHRLDMLAAWADRVIQLRKEVEWREAKCTV